MADLTLWKSTNTTQVFPLISQHCPGKAEKAPAKQTEAAGISLKALSLQLFHIEASGSRKIQMMDQDPADPADPPQQHDRTTLPSRMLCCSFSVPREHFCRPSLLLDETFTSSAPIYFHTRRFFPSGQGDRDLGWVSRSPGAANTPCGATIFSPV